jgi:hypothetical protein
MCRNRCRWMLGTTVDPTIGALRHSGTKAMTIRRWARRRPSLVAASGMAILSVTAGCDAAPGGQPSHTVRDSAGIQIVESVAPAWEEGEGWRVEREPMLTIGVLDGPEEYQLFRAASPLRTSRGEIVVANTGSFELRYYHLNGTYLRAVGRKGGGPGEFAMMGRIWRLGPDSLVLFDFGNNRLSVHGIDGSFGRTMRLEQVGAIPLPMGVFADGSILAYWHLVSDGPTADGLQRTPRMYAIWDADGAFVDSIARLPGSEAYAVSVGAGTSVSTGRPFGRSPVVIARGERWYYGSSDRYEIEVRAMDGTLERLIRRPVPNRPVTEHLIEERERRLRERRAARGVTTPTPFDDIAYPADMPAYEDVRLDAGGSLWVAYYRLEDEPVRWAVFDPEGRWLGDVETPSNGRVWDIGHDYLLGVWQDDLAVQQVRMYRIVKDVP